jgi:hypothetical protein
MIGRIPVVTILVFIGACASSGPEAPAPAVTASSASVDTVASDNPSAPPAGDLQDLDEPDTPQTAGASPENDPDELICRRERETGSKFTTRICRTRAEIEARQAQDQEIMKSARKIRTGSECVLSGDC